MNWLPPRYRSNENPQMTERRIELAVVALLFMVGLWLVVGMVRLGLNGGPAPLFPAADSLAVQSLSLEEPLSSADATRILERPLFWEGRRPLAPPPVVAAQPTRQAPVKLEGVTLQGVYGAGDALGLIATVDGALQRIGRGQSVKGWQLSAYEDGVASFVSGGRTATLPLELATPSVKVARVAKPVERDASSPDEGSSPDTEQQPTGPEEQMRLRYEGGGLTFGGGNPRQGKQSK